MLLTIDPHEPEHWLVAQVVRELQKGAVVVIPTDTVYAVVCDVANEAGAERMYRLKGMDSRKLLSVLCADLGMAAQFTRGIPNTLFRVVRRKLPGPYTFILPASKELPRVMRKNRKTVGIRIPDCPITLELISQYKRPLLSTSVAPLGPGQWLLDPYVIEEEYGRDIDLVVDGGPLFPEPSTVIDFSGFDPVVVREGKGPVDFL
jgi:tRNA threonylcarbamoyl adenosine modification protein (Sua5/YciO/YrdC/YwlC family)